MEFWNSSTDNVLQIIKIFLEIGILSFFVYSVLLFLRGTRGTPILAGIFIFTVVLGSIARLLGLDVINWLLAQLWTFVVLFIMIIFQPELRRAFATLGSHRQSLLLSKKREKRLLVHLLKSVFSLAEKKIGALIVIERDIGLRNYAETGTAINSKLSSALLSTFFYPNTPLHDGAVIIKGQKILAAGCFLPLTDNPELQQTLGTRHRAAVGMTEETDAIVIVVSEESGTVSLANRGRLLRGVDKTRLKRHMLNYLVKKTGQHGKKTMRANIDEFKSAVAEEATIEEAEKEL
ncbi:MAG: diadenylate cyclase CdaA [Verrucomicrobiota bacterium]|nr:diadenylate cyclase CdaA [Verrucomicrobiota bacterium]